MKPFVNNLWNAEARPKLKANFLQDLTGEYQVELVFTMTKEMAGKTYSLEVTNGLGTTKYEFKLALSEAPPSGN